MYRSPHGDQQDIWFWFPQRALRAGHFPLWTWLFQPFWLILVPVYAIWLVGLAALFAISIAVNIIRLATHHEEKPPAARYDPYTGERLTH